ncbi:Cation efflux system protein CusB precursor [Lacunisphaera limnophila]|uniref:Cation efflux system protein CusB n=1 Tax=Lacunisphaera limnophila TaxID=1838286 RepID=A0A1D8AS86_9BACT|nr:efflux RND transporter periplasmic adaptor subunit [Lacunisphaera limnophila]AOS43747.1 Cation efflux system protein CusB precursor [Lacunisphaera limnophila]
MKTFLTFLAFAFAALSLAAAEPGPVHQCPMHPWIKSDKPDAKCTICGMALVAATQAPGGSDQPLDPNLVTLTASQASVTGVQSAPVTRGPLVRSLRVNGVIDDDETRHRILAARVPGRVERLHVNYVGAEVKQGEPLATIFSPEMLTAQRQFVERLKAGSIAFSASDRAAARERLLELGLTEEEIRILEGTLQPTALVNIRAPMSGTVVSRDVYEGQYVETNDKLFEIGDFSRMWFVFDVYESDLGWVRPGQTVELALPSLPGRILTAPVTFIDPNLNETTRTARARVVLDNTDRQLLHRQTGIARVIIETPETLLVPRSAVLQHRGHPVVFVDGGQRGFAAREVRLGRIGDTTAEVIAGLAEGDQVVTQGALLLDGQAQLAHAANGSSQDHGTPVPAKVSAAEPGHDETGYNLLRPLAFAAADAAAALAADDLPGYQHHLPALRATLAAYLAGHAPASRGPLAGLQESLRDGPDLDAARRAFEPFSTALVDLARAAHLTHREKLHAFECPMTPVLGNGRWLSRSAELRNPYFGSAMLECGDELK